jgi:hypothetical protein
MVICACGTDDDLIMALFRRYRDKNLGGGALDAAFWEYCACTKRMPLVHAATALLCDGQPPPERVDLCWRLVRACVSRKDSDALVFYKAEFADVEAFPLMVRRAMTLEAAENLFGGFIAMVRRQ